VNPGGPQAPVYPLSLRLAGRRAVVIGGGTVAVRRVAGLRAAGADVLVVAPELSPALADLAARGLITARRRGYSPADLAGAWLVMACTDRPEVNAAVAAEADRQRIWCVRADDAEASAAWVPAVGRSGGVTVAVNAARNPRRAAALRDRLLAAIETPGHDSPTPGSPALPTPPQPSHTAPGTPGTPIPPQPAPTTASGPGIPAVPQPAPTMPSSPGTPTPPQPPPTTAGGLGWVSIVGGGPGDPGLITVTGRQRLASADVVVADRLAPLELLDELAPDVKVIDAAKVPGGPAMRQDQINQVLVEHARAGRAVVRLKGGDPFVFGRGREEVDACLAAGVPVEVVPGVTSAVAVPAAVGIPVTHRGVSQGFCVVAGYASPGDARNTVNWAALARSGLTLVLLMGVEHLADTARALLAGGLPAGTPGACVSDGWSKNQRVVTAPLAGLAAAVRDAGITNPAVIVIGDVSHFGPATPGIPFSPSPPPTSPGFQAHSSPAPVTPSTPGTSASASPLTPGTTASASPGSPVAPRNPASDPPGSSSAPPGPPAAPHNPASVPPGSPAAPHSFPAPLHGLPAALPAPGHSSAPGVIMGLVGLEHQQSHDHGPVAGATRIVIKEMVGLDPQQSLDHPGGAASCAPGAGREPEPATKATPTPQGMAAAAASRSAAATTASRTVGATAASWSAAATTASRGTAATTASRGAGATAASRGGAAATASRGVGAATASRGTYLRVGREGRRVLVLGGARSGKSVTAEGMLTGAGTVDYVATSAPPGPEDAEWDARVREHRRRRPPHWRTLETLALEEVLAAPDPATPALVDCLTLWLARVMDATGAWDGEPGAEEALAGRLDGLVAAWRETCREVIAVSNEIGAGVVPETASGRRFRDELGRLNARIAAVSDEVWYCIAGIARRLR
jgi:uroporphyrin-III C-methyltransferase / precorrin-2 dehydrogenase / sirohydrochlorin ferrochelatase